MWTVKLHVMPIVVTGHLLLGMMTFWLLFWLYLRVNPRISPLTARSNGLVVFARFAMGVLFLEIVLGGWVSANYAALACSGFPQCNGSWWPSADYQTALDLFSGLSTGYTGVIAFDAQVAANWLHQGRRAGLFYRAHPVDAECNIGASSKTGKKSRFVAERVAAGADRLRHYRH